jgi:hypothetical protein
MRNPFALRREEQKEKNLAARLLAFFLHRTGSMMFPNVLPCNRVAHRLAPRANPQDKTCTHMHRLEGITYIPSSN